jgi:hypothetical protein
MANMASVAYAIEGPQKDLEEILGAICLAITDGKYWDEYSTCLHLGFTEKELEDKRLGGDMNDEPEIVNGVLRLSAEERWGLQDFEQLLRQKFPNIKVYWQVEECGCEVYCTNDKEGKYFPEKYWVDTAQDDIYESKYFNDDESMWKWLNEKYGVKSKEEVEAWNANYEDSGTDDENFICIHEFEVDEEE